eukprot:Pgem_evm2s1863
MHNNEMQTHTQFYQTEISDSQAGPSRSKYITSKLKIKLQTSYTEKDITPTMTTLTTIETIPEEPQIVTSI